MNNHKNKKKTKRIIWKRRLHKDPKDNTEASRGLMRYFWFPADPPFFHKVKNRDRRFLNKVIEDLNRSPSEKNREKYHVSEEKNEIKDMKEWVKDYETTLERIEIRISALTLERDNFQNKWLHHPERLRIINENTLEINFLERYAEITEKRLKELKDSLKKNLKRRSEIIEDF